MYINGTLQLTNKIRRYDGYHSEPIWKPEGENESTYDNVWMDSQCSVPIKNIVEVKKELMASLAEKD
ncbi:MAG: hypothetical protein LUC90_05080 [Lachnospiraceae bacterium]|nr:hypothetical protein [Lachnospiraceae bacterium]